MFVEYAKLFYQQALQLGYQFNAPDISHLDINNELKIIVLQKNIGKDICMLRLINVEQLDFNQYKEEREQLTSHIESVLLNKYASRIFITDVFAGSTIPSAYQYEIENADEFFEQPIFVSIFGAPMNDTSTDIITGKNKPLFIGQVNQLLTQTKKEYLHKNYIQTSNLFEIKEHALKNTLFPKRSVKPYISYALFAINGLMLLLLYITGGITYENLLHFGALEPSKVFIEHEYYRLFSVMFLHGGFIHFLSNGLGLYIFGTRLEQRLGHAKFIILYLLCGLCGSLFSLITLDTIAVGASGAIYGLVGAAFAITLVSKQPLDGLHTYFFLVYTIFGLSFGLFTPQILNSAHVGGFISGFLLLYISCTVLQLKGKKHVETN